MKIRKLRTKIVFITLGPGHKNVLAYFSDVSVTKIKVLSRSSLFFISIREKKKKGYKMLFILLLTLLKNKLECLRPACFFSSEWCSGSYLERGEKYLKI
jgi:hypothetical protein